MQNTDIQKKIFYKAKYRGTREGDRLMQGFCAHFVPTATDAELLLFLDFLELNDQNILYMVRYQHCPYPEFQNIVNKLIAYVNESIL